MKHFILNTNALAQSKEGALVAYPEREKDPIFWYKKGEVKKEIVYASAYMANNYISGSLYGMETNQNLRGMHIRFELSPASPVRMVIVKTDFDTNLSFSLMHQLWSGGPYSFLKALVVLEEEISKGTDRESTCWLRNYLLEGGIGSYPQQRMKYRTLFDKFAAIFTI